MREAKAKATNSPTPKNTSPSVAMPMLAEVQFSPVSATRDSGMEI